MKKPPVHRGVDAGASTRPGLPHRLPRRGLRLRPHRPRGVTPPARPPRDHLPADQEVEGVPGPRTRRQARPGRTRHGALPGPGVRVRRVRSTGHPPGPAVPGLRDPGQPVGAQGRRYPPLGKETQRRTVLDSGLRFMGRPGRSPLRTVASVHHRRLRPPPPHCADQDPARLLSAPAQRQRPPPRTSWPPNARAASASEARKASAGADAPSHSQPQPESLLPSLRRGDQGPLPRAGPSSRTRARIES